MIYVLDGPDGAGKSTLAKEYARTALCIPVYHVLGVPPGVVAMSFFADLFYRNSSAIFDRFIVSEYVYGPLLRDHFQVSLGDIQTFVDFTLWAMPKWIICLPPFDVCQENWREKLKSGDQVNTEDLFRRSYARFEEVLYHLPLHFERHDYTRSEAYRSRITAEAG